MTIARRILLLAAAVPLVLAALGVLNHVELTRIESRTRFVVETRVPGLSTLEQISAQFQEMRVALRDHLLAPDPASRPKAGEGLAATRAEMERLLRQYADTLVSDDQDRRLLDDFRASNAQWVEAAAEVAALTDAAGGTP